jgi:hypothetical protein
MLPPCLGCPCACRYDLYTGGSAAEQLRDANNFQTGSNIRTRKYGWSSYLCSGVYSSICEVPAEAFPCATPPMESPSPPSPPLPPSPPSPPTCGQR